MKGLFLTVEGGEGSGKSTNMSFIREYLEAAGKSLLVTREPGGTPLAETIRGVLLDPANKGMAVDTELLLMFAARAEHLQQKILPALADGQWVLCDRFTDATYAYQGGGRGIDVQRIAELEQWVQQGLRPDLTLLLDVPVEVGMQRVGQRGEKDRFEQEKEAFFQRVRQNYLAQAAADPARYRIVDASQSLEEVQRQIREFLDEALSR